MYKQKRLCEKNDKEDEGNRLKILRNIPMTGKEIKRCVQAKTLLERKMTNVRQKTGKYMRKTNGINSKIY